MFYLLFVVNSCKIFVFATHDFFLFLMAWQELIVNATCYCLALNRINFFDLKKKKKFFHSNMHVILKIKIISFVNLFSNENYLFFFFLFQQWNLLILFCYFTCLFVFFLFFAKLFNLFEPILCEIISVLTENPKP